MLRSASFFLNTVCSQCVSSALPEYDEGGLSFSPGYMLDNIFIQIVGQ